MSGFRAVARRFAQFPLSVIRRGKRQIIWPSETVRVGNLLYYWLQAARRNAGGSNVRVLTTQHSIGWKGVFAGVDGLLIDRDGVRLVDDRSVDVPAQRFGIDFSIEDLDDFIKNYLIGSEGRFRDAVEQRKGQYDLTVNVRRGDYYSVPEFRGDYSFDVVEYVRTALTMIREERAVDRICVVSDDPAWCRVKLSWLREIAEVTGPADDATAVDHLAILAASPRLILANSTFSYWGGYVSSWLHRDSEPDNATGIWAPWFHSRRFLDGAAFQLDPTWHIVCGIPGGWDG